MKGEGHYTVKRVKKLPKKGNANWLYILKTDPVDKFYIWLLNGSYQEINVGTSSNINIYSSDGTIPANTIRQVHLQNDLSSFQLDVLGTPNLFTFGRDESTYMSPSIYISSTDETNIIELGDALPMQITANSGRISTVVGTDVTTVTTSAEIKTSNNSAALYVDINSAEAGMRGGFLTMKGQVGANYLGEVGVNASGIDILSVNSIRLQTGDGTNTIPSVVGEVWTATGVFGEGHWAPPQGAGGLKVTTTIAGSAYELVNSVPGSFQTAGQETLNLSFASGLATNPIGTTGYGSIAIGHDLSASAPFSIAIGGGNKTSGPSTINGGGIVIGRLSTCAGDESYILGNSCDTTAYGAVTIGSVLSSQSKYNVVVGCFNTITIGSNNQFIGTEPIFEVGNGQSNSIRSNALTILKNGTIIAPSLTNSLITTAGAKVLISKEYADANYKKLTPYTVATLPAGTVGDTAYVTDATAPTYLGNLTGGGTVTCPVFFDGTNWVSH